MTKFNVTLGGKPMNFGGLGRASTAYTVHVEVDEESDAVQAARDKIREEGTLTEFADGPVRSVERVRTYAVTLRGKKDRRRRETFYVEAGNDRDAINALGYRGGVYSFAGSLWHGTRTVRDQKTKRLLRNQPCEAIVSIKEVN